MHFFSFPFRYGRLFIVHQHDLSLSFSFLGIQISVLIHCSQMISFNFAIMANKSFSFFFLQGLFGKQQMNAWSWAFHDLTTGPLKRKGAVIK